MKFQFLAAGAAFVVASAAASSALAAAGNTLAISFSAPVAAVPLSPITLVALGLGIGGLAIAFIGRRQGWRMMAPGLALVLGATAVFAGSEVRADATEHDLTTASGETFVLVGEYNDFINKTGATITLIDVTPSLTDYGIRPNVATCATGIVLAPGAVCVFNISPMA